MDKFQNKTELKYLLVRLVFSLVVAAFISTLKLDFIEGYFIDFRFRTKALLGFDKPKNSPISIIIINSKTVEKLQGEPKFKDHVKLLNLISSQNPKFIIYEFRTEDENFVDISGTNEEKAEFASQTKSIPNLYFSTQQLKMKGVVENFKLPQPLDTLALRSMPFTADMKSFGKDGVSRRLMFQYQDQTMMQPLIAAHYNPEIQNLSKIRGQFFYLDTLQTYINHYPKGAFATYSFENVIDGKVPKNAFENGVVLIGTDLDKDPADYSSTPYSRHFTAITKVELQANQIQTLIDNSAPIKLPRTVDIIITILISILTVHVTLSLKPARGLIILAATLFGLASVSTIAFIVFGWWIELAHPFLAIFLCYYFFIPYRLIRENRKSWEYYQKNQLLSQVEELKTNFISMMSHDLKTPIARIQGMTEVIYKDAQPLSSVQRDAIDTIRSSSDDLLKFINSILQYGRIESQGIELHKQSKDINQLLTEVIKKHEFLAKVKKIKIEQELEPLFPVQVDPELIKQVFSNLLENAIKYSPDESTVLVKSREEDDKVIIDFIDQGIGIPAVDLPNIFMKFFRTHTVKTSTIKGSGLGLYLAQYFVELHKGRITVISEQGKGSQFTVELSTNS